MDFPSLDKNLATLGPAAFLQKNNQQAVGSGCPL